MRIGLFYESQLRPLVERLELVLTQLGHVVEIDYRHQSEIDELGWVVVMNRVFNSCDGVIGVQTVDGILDDGWRGVNEEQALFAALGKPKATTFADMLADAADEILMQQCETLVEYLRYHGASD